MTRHFDVAGCGFTSVVPSASRTLCLSSAPYVCPTARQPVRPPAPAMNFFWDEVRKQPNSSRMRGTGKRPQNVEHTDAQSMPWKRQNNLQQSTLRALSKEKKNNHNNNSDTSKTPSSCCQRPAQSWLFSCDIKFVNPPTFQMQGTVRGKFLSSCCIPHPIRLLVQPQQRSAIHVEVESTP